MAQDEVVTQIGADGVRRPIDEIDSSAPPVGGRSETERRQAEEQQFWDEAVDRYPLQFWVRFNDPDPAHPDEVPACQIVYREHADVSAEQLRSVVEPMNELLLTRIHEAEDSSGE